MPFFRAGSKLVYYAHIPKCAGSSVEHYLKARFGEIALLDPTHNRVPEAQRWSKTSPQHMDSRTADRILPREIFDAAFAVVRHPVSRLVSVFKFQRDVEGLIAPGTDFSDWVKEVREMRHDLRFRYDNHLLPQVDFLPADCRLFPLENGLDPLLSYFDELTETKGGPTEFERINESGQNTKRRPSSEQLKIVPNDSDIEIIREIYEDDFEQLGYSIEDTNAASTARHTRRAETNPQSVPGPARRFLARCLRALLANIEAPRDKTP